MDKVLETSDGLRFKEKIVILDTFSVPNLIASRCKRTAMRLGSQMTKTNEVKGGGVADGVGFSPAGKFLCAANYLDSDISILRVEGAQLIDTGKRVALPGCSAGTAE
jgi:hypothetical protein